MYFDSVRTHSVANKYIQYVATLHLKHSSNNHTLTENECLE